MHNYFFYWYKPRVAGAQSWLVWKTFVFYILLVFTALWMTVMPKAWAQESERLKTESPYFYIPNAQSGVDELPLKKTDIDVRISGVIADVTVVQHYQNEGQRPIEAKYVFPGSTRAAVYAMTVRIGERVIEADIREKEKARQEYETARDEGKTAALLEEHLPNVFQMNVANIMPGDDVRVELHYTELLVPQSGNYQFVFPMVVGPRYHSPNTQDSRSLDSAAATNVPYLHEGEGSATVFNLKANIVSPLSIKEITSPSHQIDVNRSAQDREASIAMQKNEHVSNRDFILNYRLAGDQIESGIMLYEGEKENFFLAMVQPPKAIEQENISPRDYIFVVDISGSMGGFPLDTARIVVRELMSTLREQDTFNILLFSGSSATLSPHSVKATPENIQKALEMLKTYYGGGNTEMIPALRHVYTLPKEANMSRTVVIVTDGYVSVEKEAFDLVRQNLDKANVFAFGIGSSVNRYLIEGLARAGMGEPFVITKPDQAKEQARVFQQMIASPVLTSVKASFQGLDVYDVEPSHLPDVLGERPVIVFGKWRGSAVGNLVIEGQSASGLHRQILNIDTSTNKESSALKYLWARSRIDRLMDKERIGQKYQTEITELGLQYSLLTPYTSFVAIDNQVRNQEGTLEVVNQPLPMPQGVSDMAIAQRSMTLMGRVAAPMPTATPVARPTLTSSLGNDALAVQAEQEPMKQEVVETKPLSAKEQLERLQGLSQVQFPSENACARVPQMREVPGGQGQWSQRERRMMISESRSVDMEAAMPEAMPAPATVASPVVAGAASVTADEVRMPQEAFRVTAGMVDDNADFGEYMAYLKRHSQVQHRIMDVSERHLLSVKDEQGRSVPDAQIFVAADQKLLMWARTDAAGSVWLHPNVFDPKKAFNAYEVFVRKGEQVVMGTLKRSDKSALELVISGATVTGNARLDLVFLIDSTGSMGDEIAKLQLSLQSIVAQVSQLPNQPDLCLGLVTYRDKGDEYLLRSYDMTNDVPAFQKILNAMQANGGGDMPEAMNEAFHETVKNMSWRGENTTRLVILLADAPPHLDYGGPQYDEDTIAALGMGVKVFSVGASGLDEQGEYIQRQIAQYTGGKFVFLTYADASNPASGPGKETVHDVSNYSVQTLDKLIVRLIEGELRHLPNWK